MKSEDGKTSATPALEPVFYLSELREHSQMLFGVKPEVLDGVFLNAKKTQVTKTEVKNRINAFLMKGVTQ